MSEHWNYSINTFCKTLRPKVNRRVFYLYEKSKGDYPKDSSSHARQRERIKSKQYILRINDSTFNQGETTILHGTVQLWFIIQDYSVDLYVEESPLRIAQG